MLENKYKTKLCERIRLIFPGCIILHGDPNEIQGIPDLFVLCNDTWFALEGKKESDSSHRPNQDYYVDYCNHMTRAAFICPENEREVLDAMLEYVITMNSIVEQAME